MENRKVDRRVKYTKMVIKDSLIMLLQQKPLTKISVKEICQHADINRATFYAHYSDPYDLLQQLELEIIAEINQYLSGYDFRNNKDAPIEVTENILEYIKQNAELFDLLLNSDGAKKFQQVIIDIIGQQHFTSSIDPDGDVNEATYIFQFLASGSVGIIQKWLADGMKKPVKEVVALILRLAIHGRSAFD